MSRRLALALASLVLTAGGGSPIGEARAQTVEVARLHCIVRPNPDGQWYVQSDVDHSPFGIALSLEQGPDYLRVFFSRTYSHAGTVQISGDDDFNTRIQGFANLGLNSSTIRVYANGQLINPADVYDYIPPGGGNFWVNVTMLNIATDVADDAPGAGGPVNALQRPEPSPSSPATRIRFSLAAPGRVSVAIFDVSGRRVRLLLDELRDAGAHEITWDGRNEQGRAVAPGIYLARMEAAGFSASEKLTLAK